MKIDKFILCLVLTTIIQNGTQTLAVWAKPSHSSTGAQVATAAKEIVDFNTQTLKFHNPDCMWAKRCTVHCIKVSRAEAEKRGGIPCKVCGG